MQNGILRPAFTSIFAMTLLLSAASANAQASNLVDLGAGTTGHSINNSGQVALDQGIYSNGTITPLPALPGQTAPASPVAINAGGQTAGSGLTQVVDGTYLVTGTQPGYVPIGYSNGTLTNIALLFNEYTDGSQWVEPGIATAINCGGQVVGYYTSLNPRSIDQPETVAFLYSNGVSTQLPSSPPGKGGIYPPSNRALGINDSGRITGTFATADSNSPASSKYDAYVFDSGTGDWVDLGQGAGYAINASGQASGELDIVSLAVSDQPVITGTYAFLYSNGGAMNLISILGLLAMCVLRNVPGRRRFPLSTNI